MKIKKQRLPSISTGASRILQRDVAWQLRVLARHVTALADRGLQATGLSHAQFILMCLIATARDDTVNALAQRAGLDQSTMSRNLEVLVKAQLAEVTTAVQDRRRRAVWLTEAGLFALARAIPVVSRLQTRLASCVGPLAPGLADVEIRAAKKAPQAGAAPVLRTRSDRTGARRQAP